MAEEEIRHGEGTVVVPLEIVGNVRKYLADYIGVNELVEGQEWSDEWIAKNIVAIVADFNFSSPVIDTKMSVIGLYNAAAADLKPWVEEATVGRLLKFGAIRLARNAMPYTAGSISFDPNSVWRQYKEMGEMLLMEWQQRRDKKKIALNTDGAWGVANTDLLTRSIYDEGSTMTVVGGLF